MWKLRASSKEEPVKLPPETIVYAIGDVHGSRELLAAMLAKIEATAKLEHPSNRAHIVMLGDYVDKGDDSKGVIDLLINAQTNLMFDWTFLKGNHEDALLTFLDRPSFGAQWQNYGGGHTLSSYGVRTPTSRDDDDIWETTAQALVAAMPPDHLKFLLSLTISLQVGGYFFVHAGIRPGRRLKDQDEADLLWIRRAFLNSKRSLPAVIVHGHSPDMEPYIDNRRIGVDTGAYATGRLTCVQLWGANVRWLHVTRTDFV